MTLASHLWNLAVGFKLRLSCPDPNLLFSHRRLCTLCVSGGQTGAAVWVLRADTEASHLQISQVHFHYPMD